MNADIINIEMNDKAKSSHKLYVESTQVDNIITVVIHDNTAYRMLPTRRQNNCKLLWSVDPKDGFVSKNTITLTTNHELQPFEKSREE